MLSQLKTYLDWLPLLGLGGGIAFLGAAYFLGLGAVVGSLSRTWDAVIDFLRPVMVGISTGAVAYFQTLWTGLVYILKMWQAIVLVITLLFATGAWDKITHKVAMRECVRENVDLATKYNELKKKYNSLLKQKTGTKIKSPSQPEAWWPF